MGIGGHTQLRIVWTKLEYSSYAYMISQLDDTIVKSFLDWEDELATEQAEIFAKINDILDK